MNRTVLAVVVLLGLSHPLRAGDVLDSMDALRFRAPKEKGQAELVAGKIGQAVRFTFAKDARSVFFTSNLRGQPAWDRAAGLSFWVRGDGSASFGGIQLIFDNDFAVRYDLCFPLRDTRWTKVTAAWEDFVPVLPGPRSKPLGGPGGNPPSKVSALWVGKWWYWGDYPACSFAIDEIRLEETIRRDAPAAPPAGAPLARVRAKLQKGEPITIVTMGDSLTDERHWANRTVSWPRLLKKDLEAKYHTQITLVNPAIGGTQLRQNLVLMPRWLARAPQPDLVTICFGFNDWDSGMRGPQFEATCQDAIDRVRRATQGKADVLLLTTLPSLQRWETMAELAEACRRAAQRKNTGLADTEKAFREAGRKDRERLYARDRTHLGPAGHERMARTVREAIERAGR